MADRGGDRPPDGDFLAGGREDEPDDDRREAGQQPWWTAHTVRSAALVAAGLVLVILVTQSGLLSAGDGAPDGGVAPEARGRLVALVDGHLAVAGPDGWSDGPDVPHGVDSATDMVAVTMPSGRSLLVGAADGTLFRVDPFGDEDRAEIGRATRVVGSTGTIGAVVVERPGHRVEEVDASTGRTLRVDPFPGYEPSAGWRPVGLIAVGTGRSLLVRRPLGDGVSLGLAATERAVGGGAEPFTGLGAVPRLLGVSPDTVLGATRDCPGPACRVLVVTITRDTAMQREVSPPDGWRFAAVRPGRSSQGLLALRSAGGGPDALARAVAGGESALLVAGSAGVDLSAGLVDDLDGTVFLLVRAEDRGEAQVRSWDPGDPARLRPVAVGSPPGGAQLVCACG